MPSAARRPCRRDRPRGGPGRLRRRQRIGEGRREPGQGHRDGRLPHAQLDPADLGTRIHPGRERHLHGQALYRSLYQYKLDGTAQYNIDPQRSMAEPPVVSDGGKTLTITLKDNTWSDGKPVTTKDIQFWYDLVSANKDKWASYRPGGFPDNIAQWSVKDDKTFSITTTKVYNTAWFVDNQLNRITPLPQHAWDKDSATAAVGDLASTPAGAKKVFDFLTDGRQGPQDLRHQRAVEGHRRPVEAGEVRAERRGHPRRAAEATRAGTSRSWPRSCCGRSPATTPSSTCCAPVTSTTGTSRRPTCPRRATSSPRATRSRRGTAGRSPTSS